MAAVVMAVEIATMCNSVCAAPGDVDLMRQDTDPTTCCSGDSGCGRLPQSGDVQQNVVPMVGSSLRNVRNEYVAALEQAVAEGDVRRQGDALLGLGDIGLKMNEALKAFRYYEEALSIFKGAGDRDGEGRAFCGCGNACRSLDRHDLDLPCYERSLEIALELNQLGLEAESRSGLASVAMRRQDMAKAKEQYRRAIDIHMHTGDKRALGLCFSNLAGVYLMSNDLTAVTMYERALDISREVNNPLDMARAAAQLTNLHDKWLGSPAGAFKYRSLLMNLLRDQFGRSLQETCCICMEDLNAQDPEARGLVVLPACLHMFHEKCLSKWFERKSICPECRT